MSGIRYQFEGPFDSSYSLAVVNREMARAVEALRPGSVALYSTEGPGDYAPDQAYLQQNQEVQTLEYWQRSQQLEGHQPAVVLRNLYPPRVSGMLGEVNALNNYAWEESVFPWAYAAGFNQHLHLVTVTSEFVRKTLIDSGVRVPVVVIGNGVDHLLRYPPELVELPPASFRFLHISSCFPRKGVDALLEAYAGMFSAKDDVLLVIKTFPNPHNTVAEDIRQWQQRMPDCPAIHLINEDLRPGQMNSLYQQANALVMPSRGEGFGMPMAEAMLWGVPVIATGFGGHRDFCTPDTAWLVDFQFALAQTHLGQTGSLWVEPDVVHLMTVMRRLYQQSQDEAGRLMIQARVTKAKHQILEGWSWSAVATRLLRALDVLPPSPSMTAERAPLAWVSTWNSRCGIASYSDFLLQQMHVPFKVLANTDSALTAEDGENVLRCWEVKAGCKETPSMAGLLNQLLMEPYSAVVIQFNFAFFDLEQLRAMLNVLHGKGIAVYVFFHATQDVIEQGKLVDSLRTVGDELKRCRRLLVHGVDDVNRLKRFGYVDNVTMIPHGVIYAPDILARRKADEGIFRIAAYGFLLPGKGIPELIEAFLLLRDKMKQGAVFGEKNAEIHLELFNALYPVSSSRQERVRCQKLIDQAGYGDWIHLHTAFQTDEQTLESLSDCDVVVFPYQTSRESSSAAVRMGLASGRPVVCTPLGIFNDVADTVHFLPDITPEAIAMGLFDLVSDPERLDGMQQKQHEWLQAHAWERVGERLDAIMTEVEPSSS